MRIYLLGFLIIIFQCVACNMILDTQHEKAEHETSSSDFVSSLESSSSESELSDEMQEQNIESSEAPLKENACDKYFGDHQNGSTFDLEEYIKNNVKQDSTGDIYLKRVSSAFTFITKKDLTIRHVSEMWSASFTYTNKETGDTGSFDCPNIRVHNTDHNGTQLYQVDYDSDTVCISYYDHIVVQTAEDSLSIVGFFFQDSIKQRYIVNELGELNEQIVQVKGEISAPEYTYSAGDTITYTPNWTVGNHDYLNFIFHMDSTVDVLRVFQEDMLSPSIETFVTNGNDFEVSYNTDHELSLRHLRGATYLLDRTYEDDIKDLYSSVKQHAGISEDDIEELHYYEFFDIEDIENCIRCR
ncbi:MAG: hypothetical protein OCD01_11775 [Fibrobacterales bacterium]